MRGERHSRHYERDWNRAGLDRRALIDPGTPDRGWTVLDELSQAVLDWASFPIGARSSDRVDCENLLVRLREWNLMDATQRDALDEDAAQIRLRSRRGQVGRRIEA